MENQSGCFNINTGGVVRSFSDPTQTVEYKQRAERRDTLLKERSTVKRPTSNERALERELWAQVSGKPSSDSVVSPKLASDYSAFRASQDRESVIEQQLMDQVSGIQKRLS